MVNRAGPEYQAERAAALENVEPDAVFSKGRKAEEQTFAYRGMVRARAKYRGPGMK